MRSGPTDRDWLNRDSLTVAGVTAYAALAGLALAVLLRRGTDPVAVAVLGAVATAGLAGTLGRVLGRRSAALRRLATDTDVIVDTNPARRLEATDAGDLGPVVVAVNRLADRHESALRDVQVVAAEARRDVEDERNRLAALMAQLTVAVVVCNTEGRILLYNESARSLLGDATPVGLGRSVFAFVDRGLVAHAYDRLAAGATVCTATTLHGERLLQVRVTLVGDATAPGKAGAGAGRSGFVLVLEDTTAQVRSGEHRARLLRELTEQTRASLGSIRAAAESVIEFPDLTPGERDRFLEVIREEAERLGRRLEDVDGGARDPGEERLLSDIAAEDLLGVLRNELARAGVGVEVTPPEPGVWVRTDGYLLGALLTQLATRLASTSGADPLTLSVSVSTGRHAQLDASWSGRPPSAWHAWLDEPLDGGSATARVLAERLGVELWCGELDPGTAYLRLLLPTAAGDPPREPTGTGHALASRPEFYDFDLFTTTAVVPDLRDRALESLAFTVLDTETTGLDPNAGDRVVSLGAVRVVNGRVLRQETFECLVQPGRPVPAASTAIHGITDDLLDGKPTLAEVLPDFGRFAEDTVLVGHNVGFDLQFLRAAAPSAGVPLRHPALDTLLLHAALHPDHDDHTLDAIATELGVSVVGRHTALGDALVTAEVFVALLGLLRRRGLRTLGAALDAARDTYEARVDRRTHPPA